MGRGGGWECWMRTMASSLLGVAVAVLVVTGCTSSGSTAAPTGSPVATTGPSTGPATQSSVSITLSPVGSASAAELAAAAKVISERVAQSGLPVISNTNSGDAAIVSGRNVVLNGLAADKAALEDLTGMGVLRVRHLLLEESGGVTSGDASLVQPGVLKLFRKLVCNPGESAAAWQQEAGYTTAADWNDPTAQVVSCSSGIKYALDAATVLGQEITGAVSSTAQSSGQPLVVLTLNSAGASAFSGLTTHLYNAYYPGTTTRNQNDMVLDQAAVVLDGTVLSASEVEAPITGGQLEIPNVAPAGFTGPTPSELAAELQSGALPVAFRIAGTSVSPN
jgi:preprotein translocase subunit SecD